MSRTYLFIWTSKGAVCEIPGLQFWQMCCLVITFLWFLPPLTSCFPSVWIYPLVLCHVQTNINIHSPLFSALLPAPLSGKLWPVLLPSPFTPFAFCVFPLPFLQPLQLPLFLQSSIYCFATLGLAPDSQHQHHLETVRDACSQASPQTFWVGSSDTHFCVNCGLA